MSALTRLHVHVQVSSTATPDTIVSVDITDLLDDMAADATHGGVFDDWEAYAATGWTHDHLMIAVMDHAVDRDDQTRAIHYAARDARVPTLFVIDTTEADRWYTHRKAVNEVEDATGAYEDLAQTNRDPDDPATAAAARRLAEARTRLSHVEANLASTAGPIEDDWIVAALIEHDNGLHLDPLAECAACQGRPDLAAYANALGYGHYADPIDRDTATWLHDLAVDHSHGEHTTTVDGCPICEEDDTTLSRIGFDETQPGYGLPTPSGIPEDPRPFTDEDASRLRTHLDDHTANEHGEHHDGCPACEGWETISLVADVVGAHPWDGPPHRPRHPADSAHATRDADRALNLTRTPIDRNLTGTITLPAGWLGILTGHGPVEQPAPIVTVDGDLTITIQAVHSPDSTDGALVYTTMLNGPATMQTVIVGHDIIDGPIVVSGPGYTATIHTRLDWPTPNARATAIDAIKALGTTKPAAATVVDTLTVTGDIDRHDTIDVLTSVASRTVTPAAVAAILNGKHRRDVSITPDGYLHIHLAGSRRLTTGDGEWDRLTTSHIALPHALRTGLPGNGGPSPLTAARKIAQLLADLDIS